MEQHLEEIRMEDILGRASIRANLDTASDHIRDKVILVTGAGGSIGSALCRRICACKPSRLILLGHGENSIINVLRELNAKFPDISIESVIADIQDMNRIRDVFSLFRPHIVFHAAAHKHVPLMEMNASEAVKNNIFGTRNVAQCALHNMAEKFVFISSDKAVNPTSMMGATKRLAEIMLMSMSKSGNTKITVVRFGNVLGSWGSVLPLFLQQIRKGGPVTVTHPEMMRYFMTIPEAVQHILQASAMSRGGEIFVPDMGKPIKIVDLARRVIRLSGFKPDEDIKIVFTGVRPGEKMVEEIFTAEEKEKAEKYDSIYVCETVPSSEEYLFETLRELEDLVSHEGTVGNTKQIHSVIHRFFSGDDG